MDVNQDDYKTREVNLPDLVELCQQCEPECRRRTSRIVSNRSRAPRGWEKDYDDVARVEQNRSYEQCMVGCTDVARACPAPAELRQVYGLDVASASSSATANNNSNKKPWWKFGFGGGGGGGGNSINNNTAIATATTTTTTTSNDHSTPVITEQTLGRCENVVGRFTSLLFALAHKPTKVMFESRDPKTGNLYDPSSGEYVNEASTGGGGSSQPRQSTSEEINKMIADRWAGGNARMWRQEGRENEEEIRRQEAAAAAAASRGGAGGGGPSSIDQMSKEGRVHAVPGPLPTQPDGSHGTVPRF